MLNFTTTTIVNSENTYSVKSTKNGKKFVVNYGPELFIDADHKCVLVGEQPYTAAKKAKATIVLPTTTGVINRIAIYIRLRNNQNEYFSNDWTFKGKPLYIEFNGGATADEIVSLAKKYMIAQYGYNLVKFSTADGEEGAGDSLVIEAVDQWEMFMDQDSHDGVAVQKLVTVDMAGTVINAGDTANSPTHEEFVKDDTATVTVDNGNEAFGDFAHIVKDLRLPSAANLRWQGIAQGDIFGDEPNDDKPLPTGKYTQYTVQLTAERGVLGGVALGGVAVSRTTHVFYVESAVADDFKTKLLEAGVTNFGSTTTGQILYSSLNLI
jgi:hypothetical protein